MNLSGFAIVLKGTVSWTTNTACGRNRSQRVGRPRLVYLKIPHPLTLEFTVMLECHDLYSPDDAAGAPAAAGSSR